MLRRSPARGSLETLKVGGKPYGVAVETVSSFGAYLHAWVADYAGGRVRRF